MDIKLNTHFLDVKETYLFSDIAKRVKKFQAENPGREIIRMGIGDVTLPLPQSVTSAMEEAVKEMSAKDTFHIASLRLANPAHDNDRMLSFLNDALCRTSHALTYTTC